MPSRNLPLVNNEYYHVFNRGVAKMPIFTSAYEYKHFIKAMLYYQLKGPKPRLSLFAPETSKVNIDNKIVNIICYALMPNHFHFLLQQVSNDGISEFISKLSNSYTKYFNIKNDRVGPLLQGPFKAVHVESDEQLVHLSRYIHLNPIVGFVTKSLDHYAWSSYKEYIETNTTGICSKDIILKQFSRLNSYREFVLDQVGYGKHLELIKHQLFD